MTYSQTHESKIVCSFLNNLHSTHRSTSKLEKTHTQSEPKTPTYTNSHTQIGGAHCKTQRRTIHKKRQRYRTQHNTLKKQIQKLERRVAHYLRQRNS